MGPRIGVAENHENVRNQPPLSSALFYIRLVIRHFLKRQRTGLWQTHLTHAAILPDLPGKVYLFSANPGHCSPANPHSPLIPLTAL